MHADHHVLRDVFGLRPELLAENRDGQTEHRSPIAPDELGEGGLVDPLATSLDEPLVRLVGCTAAVQRPRSEARR